MIMRTDMHTLSSLERAEFWADTYGGRPIAIFNREGKWHVYLDHALQHNTVFATAEDAIAWLTQRIDRHASGRQSPAPQAA
jgi:hypothetical protein